MDDRDLFLARLGPMAAGTPGLGVGNYLLGRVSRALTTAVVCLVLATLLASAAGDEDRLDPATADLGPRATRLAASGVLVAGALVLVAGALVLVAGALVLVAGALVLVAGALVLVAGALVLVAGALVLVASVALVAVGLRVQSAQTSTKFRRMVRPVSPDFSGWNWVPKTVPASFATTLGNGSP